MGNMEKKLGCAWDKHNSTLQVFRTEDGKTYLQAFDYTDDASYIYSVDSEELLFKVDAMSVAFNGKGLQIGAFGMDAFGYWKYAQGNFELSFGNKDLLKTEIKTFKHLITKGFLNDRTN